MNQSVSRLGQTLLHNTGAIEGRGDERDRVVLGKNGFKSSGDNRVGRSIKHFLGIGTGTNRKSWAAAAKALDLNVDRNARLRSYMESGKSLTMRRLQKVMENPNNRKEFTEKFGLEAITQRISNQIRVKFGENKPEELQGYQSTIKSECVNNGTYVKNNTGHGSFAEFHRMEHGTNPPDNIRNEKVHLTVHPDDIDKAYEALAPLLNDPGCPLGRWKVVNMDEARVEIIQLTDQVTNNPGDLALQRKLDEAQRLHDGAQFTLYVMEGQEGPEIAAFLRQLEEALREAGVRTTERPGSDEPLPGMDFSSFRIGSRTYMPGEEGYEEALIGMGPSGVRGEPATRRVDPFDTDYAQFQTTFRDNPFYQSLV